jgi:uncharacterized protein (TIGR03067 family)
MRTLILFLVAGCSLGFAPAPLPKPDSSKEDLRKMQGEWVRVRCVSGGNTLVIDGQVTAVFKGNRMRISLDGRVQAEWVITLDAAKKLKVLDQTAHSGLVEKGLTYRGVYRLEGNTLSICSRQGTDVSNRPTNLTGGGKNDLLRVYKRRKR